MSQPTLLISALKKVLKNQGVRYRDLAEVLGLSEASIKRMFSEGNLSIRRLGEVCAYLGVNFTDLANIMDQEERRTDRLNEQQEYELVADIKLLLMAFLVINGFHFGEIQRYYRYTDAETIRYLAHLDRIGIIDLFPNNRIRLKISPKFTWRRDGPIQKFFTQRLQPDFLASQFLNEGESHFFLTAMLSPESAKELEKRIHDLVIDFQLRNQQDGLLPLEQRTIYSMLLGMRSWHPSAFEELRL
ncbi:MAG: helix-turn-helix transcriptional regulator [Gammaproteobacteria bacterium]|nr:helix-turn-helix transcriptional regulator [Gammaproteobacteria bacterium]